MGPLIALAAAALFTDAVAAAVFTVFAEVLVSIGTSIILGAIAGSLTKKPTPPDSLVNRAVTSKQPISPWQIIFGTAKVGGALTFMASYASATLGGTAIPPVNIKYTQTNTPPGFPNSIPDSYFYVSQIDSRSWRIYFSAANQGLPVSIQAGGITQSFVIPTPTSPGSPISVNWVFPSYSWNSISSWKVTATKPASVVNQPSNPLTGTSNRLEYIITVAGHEIDSFSSLYFGDIQVTLDNSFGTNSKGHSFGGNADASTIYGQGGVFASVFYSTGSVSDDAAFNAHGRAHATDLWDSTCMQAGKAKMWITLIWNANLWSSGIPDVSVIANGAMPFDPRTGLKTWSVNPVLLTRFYLQLMGIVKADPSPTNMDDTVTIAGANTCEESVALNDGSVEQRFTCNGVIDTSRTPQQVIPELLGSMMGKIVYVGGKWTILVGAWRTPTIAFDEDDLDGNPSTQTAISARENYNAVKGTFFNPAAFWQPDDFPEVTNATYAAQDGKVIYNDIQLPFTISTSMCQRIGKICIEQVRQAITTTWPCKLTALQCQAGDVVLLNRTRLGWVNKPFEVMSWQFAVRGSGDNLRIGIDMQLRETASGVYDWNSGEQTTVDLAPNTNLPSPFLVSPPGTPTMTEELYITRQNAVKVQATLMWPVSTSLSAVQYQAEYQLYGPPAWIILPLTNTNSVIIPDIAPGIYSARVKAINQQGVSSAYCNVLTQEIYGLSAIPDDITGLTIQGISSLGYLSWTQSTDLDVTVGGKIAIRHTEAVLASAIWENSYSIVDAVGGSVDHAVVPLKKGTYLVKAISSSGIYSANPAKVYSDGTSLFSFTPLTTIQEDPTFPGTNTSTVVVGSQLQLAGAGNWDDIPDLDAHLGFIDSFGGISMNGTYGFNSGFNFGSVKTVRVTTSLAVQTVNVLNLVDSRIGLVDDWDNWDGTNTGGAADCVIQARTTQTNPSGSPVWSPWANLVIGDYTAWGMQFQALLSSTDPAYNVFVTSLGVASATA